ncbi:MAG: GntR family transcriptional regulator [Lachnospiraceae bacterium]|nr:GntR family transcriptional regulator [Lachnospiraceae bacterium]
MSFIDYRDNRPIYEQIVEYYKRLILSGAIKTDEQMPSVRGLAMELSTNPNTIQKAYAQLERDGFIYTVKGRGNFVKEKEDLMVEKENEIIGKLKDIIKEAAGLGLDFNKLFEKAKAEGEKGV